MNKHVHVSNVVCIHTYMYIYMYVVSVSGESDVWGHETEKHGPSDRQDGNAFENRRSITFLKKKYFTCQKNIFFFK